MSKFFRKHFLGGVSSRRPGDFATAENRIFSLLYLFTASPLPPCFFRFPVPRFLEQKGKNKSGEPVHTGTEPVMAEPCPTGRARKFKWRAVP